MLMVNSRWVGAGYQHFTAASGIFLQLLDTGSTWSPCSSLFSQLAPCRCHWDNKCDWNHFYNNCHQLYYGVANEKHVAAAFGWIIISEARNASRVLHCCGGSLGVQGSSVVLFTSRDNSVQENTICTYHSIDFLPAKRNKVDFTAKKMHQPYTFSIFSHAAHLKKSTRRVIFS